MKFSFTLLLGISILFACDDNPKSLNEDFNAFCFVSNGAEINLGGGIFMNTPKIHYVLFIYHDSIFQVSIENNKSTYTYLKFRNYGKDSLQSILKEYNKTSLKEQLKSMNATKGTNCDASCGPEGYFLSGSNEKMNFGIFHYNDYSNWSGRYSHKEIKLKPCEFPKIYQTIYYTLNSKQWDYFMSNNYYYKNVRTYRRTRFLEDSKL